MKPKISVLIPLYNKEKFIADTLKSIDKQVTRGEFSIEVVIVDDSSTDNSFEIAQNYTWENPDIKVIVLQNEVNSGPSVSFNKAFDASSGEYIVPFDADDLLLRLGIYSRFKFLVANPEIDWVSGSVLKLDDNNVFKVGLESVRKVEDKVYQGLNFVSDLLKDEDKIQISAQSLMLRREPVSKTRWIDKMRSSPELGLMLRIVLAGYKLRFIDDYVAVYRSRTSMQKENGLFGQSVMSGQKVKDFETLKKDIESKLTQQQLEDIDKIIFHFKNHPYLS